MSRRLAEEEQVSQSLWLGVVVPPLYSEHTRLEFKRESGRQRLLVVLYLVLQFVC
jgi:hypothetical protein